MNQRDIQRFSVAAYIAAEMEISCHHEFGLDGKWKRWIDMDEVKQVDEGLSFPKAFGVLLALGPNVKVDKELFEEGKALAVEIFVDRVAGLQSQLIDQNLALFTANKLIQAASPYAAMFVLRWYRKLTLQQSSQLVSIEIPEETDFVAGHRLAANIPGNVSPPYIPHYLRGLRVLIAN